MRLKIFRLILPLFVIFSLPSFVSAQEQEPELPTYIVQTGDTLFSISIRFGISLDELIQANNLENPDILSPGTIIKIPGLEGISGTLTTETIQLGETLRSLSIHYQIPINQISKLNRLTGPMEAYAGASLVLPEEEVEKSPQSSYVLEQNQSMLDLSGENRINPWLLSQVNHMQGTWDILPGEAIFTLPENNNQQTLPQDSVSLVSPFLNSVQITPLPLVQGFTFVVKIDHSVPLELEGTLGGHNLKFFRDGTNTLVALQGIHAMAMPGITPFTLKGSLQDGRSFSFEQMVVLQAAGYSREDIIGVDPTTIDPEVTQPENDLITGITSKISDEKYWDGLFLSPGYDPNWITSWFGTRRSYNESTSYSFFHTGVDYGGGTGLEIKSPAAGVVVFAEPLVVRGNATIIDHGWGVFSGFWHQSEFKVQVGDKVEKGQVIGLVGGTGRVTGAHLHWEIWVNGVQVNPLTWLSQTYP